METSQEIFRALGMTLIHSLWQGAIIAAAVIFILMLAGKANARARYAIHFGGLVMLLISFVATFVIIFRNNQALTQLQHAMLTVRPENGFVRTLPLAPSGLFQQILGIIEPFSPYLAWGWLVGFLLTALRMSGGAILARMTFRKDLTLPDEYLNDVFTGIKKAMGLPEDIKLKISQHMISPLVTGIISPLVIIPAAAISGMSPEQIRSIMIHELAHISRYDHILVLIQAIARLILFFHPLAWYLLPEIDRERENCCDDFVVRNNNNPINYIKALAMIQEMNLPGAPENALTGKSNQLLSRIRRLIKPETRHTPVFRLAVVLLFALTLGTLSMAFIITGQPDVKTGNKLAFESNPVADPSPLLNGTASAVIRNNEDGDKKKMVIIFDNDTIKEMTVNGKKLSREEMKEYADEIRKVQRELESTQEEMEIAHREFGFAHKDFENAQKEFELTKRDEEFYFDFNSADWNKLNDLNKLNELNIDIQKFNELNNLNEHNFHFEQLNQQFRSQEFQEKMKKAQEEAMKAFEDAREKSREYMNSEEFREKMQKAQEEAMKAFEEAKDKNSEFFNSEEFREQMRKANEEARKAMDELRKSGMFENEFNFKFDLEHPPVMPGFPHAPGYGDQEPPSPRPEPEVEPEVPEVEEEQEIPEVPEIPEVEEQFEQQEQLEIEEAPEIEQSEQMEIEEKQEPNPKSDEMDDKLRELEEE